MKRFITHLLVIVGILVSRNFVYADHDKSCKNVHGKVTAITEDGVIVGDKLYKVGKTTRITRGDRVIKLDNLSTGDLVCVDTRGKDDIGSGEVAGLTVLVPTETVRETTRETTTILQPTSRDQGPNRIYGKVTRVGDSTIVVEGQPHTTTTTTVVTKDGRTTKIETVKPGDFVRLDEKDAKVTSVVVLSPAEAAPFQSREIIRET